ncbi:MAG: lysophospholipid acyltransferase family protein [Planctomycetota bacterium]
MAKDQPLLVQYSQYAALRTVSALMSSFSVDQNLRTAATIGSLFYRLNPRRRRRAEANLARSFPGWTPTHVSDVAERSMQHMFKLFLVDALMTPRKITPDSWPRHVRVGRLGLLLDRLVRHEPAILVTGHCGNWELLGHALAMLGFPLVALARPLDNRFINRWLLEVREARGMRILTKWGATPVVEQVLRDGDRIGFIADQNAGEGGLFVPFFGRLASSYKSIGLLAMRHEVPVIAGTARRCNGGLQYEVSCCDYIAPGDWADQPDPLFYITARFNRAIERMIRESPEQYLWLHRRWKSRPRHERLGKPMPARLIEKLQSLPWMTEAELDRIVEQSNREAAEHR